MVTCPSLNDSRKFRQRRKVLLPDPEGPITHSTSPSATSQSMPLSTSSFPKLLCRPSTVMIMRYSVRQMKRVRRSCQLPFVPGAEQRDGIGDDEVERAHDEEGRQLSL